MVLQSSDFSGMNCHRPYNEKKKAFQCKLNDSDMLV
jgi:hypothetical protein